MKYTRIVLMWVLVLIGLAALVPFTVQAGAVPAEPSMQRAGLNAPSIAVLASFSARVMNHKNVRLKWQTGTEYTLVGFNLYRKTKQAAEWEKLNRELIPPKGMGTLQGSLYNFTDKKAQMGKKYQYQLEMVGSYGNTAYSDIVSIKMK